MNQDDGAGHVGYIPLHNTRGCCPHRLQQDHFPGVVRCGARSLPWCRPGNRDGRDRIFPVTEILGVGFSDHPFLGFLVSSFISINCVNTEVAGLTAGCISQKAKEYQLHAWYCLNLEDSKHDKVRVFMKLTF